MKELPKNLPLSLAALTTSLHMDTSPERMKDWMASSTIEEASCTFASSLHTSG